MKVTLPRQYKTGNLLGAFVFMYCNASVFIGIMLSFMNAGTFYIVASGYFPQLAIWQFYLILIFIVYLIMVMTFMLVTPSVIAFSNEQACKHENPVIERLERLEKKIDVLSKEVRK